MRPLSEASALSQSCPNTSLAEGEGAPQAWGSRGHCRPSTLLSCGAGHSWFCYLERGSALTPDATEPSACEGP